MPVRVARCVFRFLLHVDLCRACAVAENGCTLVIIALAVC